MRICVKSSKNPEFHIEIRDNYGAGVLIGLFKKAAFPLMFSNFRAANFVFFLLHILSQKGDCFPAVAFLCSNLGGKSAFVSFEGGE